MQVTETVNEGLKREIKIVVPATDLEAKLVKRLNDAKDKVRIKGFRPGKVPVNHLRQIYGKSLMAEVVNEIINESPSSVLEERGEKAALRPEISMTEDEKEASEILAGKQDFEFSISYEIVPDFELQDVSSIQLTRPVYDVPEKEIEENMMRVAESARSYEPKSGKAENGDRVTIDFTGKIDGVPFEGGADTDANLVLGANQFIPGFEEGLVGVKAGDETEVKVTFPEDYSAAHLAGKDAVFEVKVKEVAKPGKLELTDEVAKSLGLDSLEKLREIIVGQIENQYGSITRQKVKRQLLDALDEMYKFDVPSKLVDAEFNNIWSRVTQDLEREGKTFEDEDTTEEEARAEYQRLSERRVRLGLVFSAMGEKSGVEVTEEEVQRALYDEIRRYPGQEQQVYEFYKNNPNMLANLRAPIFEDKVVDNILSEAKITDKKVTREELLAEDEEEGAEKLKKAAPKKKAAAKKDDSAEKPAKKAPAKKKAAAKEDEAK
jgi:trigger factor